MKTLQDYIDKLNTLNFKEMYNGRLLPDLGEDRRRAGGRIYCC